jgi:membrane-associated phospholipid phosphatase
MSVRARLSSLTLAVTLASPLAAALDPTPLHAQADSTAQVARPWIGWGDARLLGAFAVATAATMPFDARLATWVRRPSAQRSRVLRDGAHAFNTAGDPGSLIAAVALFGAGRVAGSRPLAQLGLHATEAIVLAGSMTTAGKLAAGRQRPNVEGGDADDFAPGRGYQAGRSSFPSGHATVAFAFASSVTADLRARGAHSATYVGPLLYTGAALVGAARMYDNKHWASDVLLGAGIGTVAGRITVAFAHAHPHGWLEGLAGRSEARR